MVAGLGRILFRHRGWLPVPLLLTQLALGGAAPWPFVLLGVALLILGEALRLWAVGHIGPQSRTRAEGTFGLVRSGPYALVRNPLYVANGLLWLGVGALSGLGWIAAWALYAAALYVPVVLWEEQNLQAALGDPYHRYRSEVPRFLPRRWSAGVGEGRWDRLTATRSERSTLVAIAVVVAIFAGLRLSGQ
ncbi:MAG: isoprenylcysteine carboxylmethyltransferase family protein [Alphaproteobacteria bacterium]|nr:isoprenylcysteine carboxylmethyltransferase family protein [Alphaproteobacteria bacterium]